MTAPFKVGDAVYLRDEVAGSRVDVFGVRPEELGRLKGVKGTVLSNGTVPNVQFPANIWCFPIEHLLPAAAYEASGGGASAPFGGVERHALEVYDRWAKNHGPNLPLGDAATHEIANGLKRCAAALSASREREAAATARIEALVTVCEAAADYLDYNSLTSIAHGSSLHRNLREATLLRGTGEGG